MNIKPIGYILGLLLQIFFMGAYIVLTNQFYSSSFTNSSLVIILYLAIEVTIFFILATKSFSAALGFVTGIFTILVFIGMVMTELIIHPPSEE